MVIESGLEGHVHDCAGVGGHGVEDWLTVCHEVQDGSSGVDHHGVPWEPGGLEGLAQSLASAGFLGGGYGLCHGEQERVLLEWWQGECRVSAREAAMPGPESDTVNRYMCGMW